MKNLTKIVMLILCVISLSACATHNYPTGNSFANQGKLKLGIRYSESNPGILVQAVQFNSIAYKAGITRGDIILTAGNTTIQNAMHFQQILQTITGKVKFGIIGQGGVIKVVTVNFGGTTTKKWTKESAIAYAKIYKEILTDHVFPLSDKVKQDAAIASVHSKEGYPEDQELNCNQKGEYYICEIYYPEKDIAIGTMSKNGVFFQLYLLFNRSDGPVEHMLIYGITKENIIHMTTGECIDCK